MGGGSLAASVAGPAVVVKEFQPGGFLITNSTLILAQDRASKSRLCILSNSASQAASRSLSRPTFYYPTTFLRKLWTMKMAQEGREGHHEVLGQDPDIQTSPNLRKYTDTACRTFNK